MPHKIQTIQEVIIEEFQVKIRKNATCERCILVALQK